MNDSGIPVSTITQIHKPVKFEVDKTNSKIQVKSYVLRITKPVNYIVYLLFLHICKSEKTVL